MRDDIRSAPEDMSRDQMIQALQALYAQSRQDSPNLTVVGGKTFPCGSFEGKKIEILTRLSIIEK